MEYTYVPCIIARGVSPITIVSPQVAWDMAYLKKLNTNTRVGKLRKKSYLNK